MRAIFFICILIVLFFSCGQDELETVTDLVNIPASAGEETDKSKLPVIEFETEIFDFGKITQGEKVSHTFKFKNTGKGLLLLSSVNSSCGCTVTEYSRKPIAAGQTGEIKVVFDSSGKSGAIEKTIIVISNCIPNQNVLKIKADIFVPEPKQTR